VSLLLQGLCGEGFFEIAGGYIDRKVSLRFRLDERLTPLVQASPLPTGNWTEGETHREMCRDI
jgi:hypothetical protein